MSYPKNQKEDLRQIAERRRVERAERRAKVLRLHRDGLNVAMIATRMQMARSTVCEVIREAGEMPIKSNKDSAFTFGDAV